MLPFQLTSGRWTRTEPGCILMLDAPRPFSWTCLHGTAQGGEAGGWGLRCPAAARSESFIRGSAGHRERFPAPCYVTLKDTETIIHLPRLEGDRRGSRSHNLG